MFTGIIEKTARIVAVENGQRWRALAVDLDDGDLRLGESVAINGVCLTVARLGPNRVGFDVISETLDRTNLGLLVAGDEVHIERSLRIGDRIDGHFVQGHVDGLANIIGQKNDSGEWRVTLETTPGLSKYLAPKGSVTLDGVSLTLASVTGNRFEVALIPTTVQLTTLARRNVGWPCNLECDILTKTVISYLERTQASPGVSQANPREVGENSR